MVHGQAFRIITRQASPTPTPIERAPLYINHGRYHEPPWEPSLVSCHDKLNILNAYRLSELNLLFILKVANIRCFILIKCSEQKARFKKSVIMS